MENQLIVQTILGMAVVTFIPRVVPMIALSGRQLPPKVERWLSFIPAALLGALLCSSLKAGPDDLTLWGFDLRDLLAAVPAAFIALRTRSIMLTVTIGIAAAILVRMLLA